MAVKTDAVPPKWDASQMPLQVGRTAIVTGGNSGIGYEAALALARKGATVVLACRSKERGLEAQHKIEEELQDTHQAGKVEFMQLDLSSLESVKTFTSEYLKTHDRLDLLINNAGIMSVPYSETKDGLESQMATNHLGHFALTAGLFDLLKKSAPSRVVNVSSGRHQAAIYDGTSLLTPESNYHPNTAYSDSKLSNILFTKELGRRLQAAKITGVVAAACHPGASATNLITAPSTQNGFVWRSIWKFMWMLPIHQPAAMGALPTLYAATGSTVKNGQYFGPDGCLKLAGHPALEQPSEKSESEDLARKMWAESEKLTGIKFPVA